MVSQQYIGKLYNKNGQYNYFLNSNNKDYTIYSSLLYHQDNSNKETILEVYKTIQEVLNEK